MSRGILDISGQKYGMLIPLRYEIREYPSGNKEAFWLCRCDCGVQKWIARSHLRRRKSSDATVSCGCKNKVGSIVAAQNHLYRKYVWHAKKRNLDFKISKDDFIELTRMSCYYCDSEPRQIQDKVLIYNGIDRLNNNFGYIHGNVVAACGKCNRAKDTMTEAEFLNLAKRIYEHHFARRE